MSNSSDSRLYFEGVLDKAGKRFFEVSCVVIKCAHSGINYYVVRLFSMIGRKKEYITHKKQQFLHIRK